MQSQSSPTKPPASAEKEPYVAPDAGPYSAVAALISLGVVVVMVIYIAKVSF